MLFDVRCSRDSRRIAVSGGDRDRRTAALLRTGADSSSGRWPPSLRRSIPKVAGRLLLEPDTCEDPHVERLIEAFALLAGGVHHKLDDEFPEITEALLDVLYPHYLRPVPSQAIAQFQLDPSQSAPASTKVPAGTAIHSKPENGHVCSFRTCYPVTLWPLRVSGASVSAVNRFATRDARRHGRRDPDRDAMPGRLAVGQLPLDSLRFYLNGESAAVHTLYEFLFLNTLRVALRCRAAERGRASHASAEQPAPGRLHNRRGNAALLGPQFPGIPPVQEYFTFPKSFSSST